MGITPKFDPDCSQRNLVNLDVVQRGLKTDAATRKSLCFFRNFFTSYCICQMSGKLAQEIRHLTPTLGSSVMFMVV